MFKDTLLLIKIFPLSNKVTLSTIDLVKIEFIRTALLDEFDYSDLFTAVSNFSDINDRLKFWMDSVELPSWLKRRISFGKFPSGAFDIIFKD
jgi:hypothetical protein